MELEYILNTLLGWTNDPNVYLPVFVFGGLMFLGMLLFFIFRSPRKGSRETEMSEEGRKRLVKQIIADIFTDGVEDAIHKGTLTRREASDYYEKMGYMLGLTDLLPRQLQKLNYKRYRKLHPYLVTQLKRAIQQRINSAIYVVKANLPDKGGNKPKSRFASVLNKHIL